MAIPERNPLSVASADSSIVCDLRSSLAYAAKNCFLISTAASGFFSFSLTKIYGSRFAFLQTGIILGSIMTMNVFFVIAPNGKKIALAALKKEEFDLNLSLRAKVRSVHNNIITLLVLFIMLSGHTSFVWASPINWIILFILAIIFGMIQYYVNMKNKKESN